MCRNKEQNPVECDRKTREKVRAHVHGSLCSSSTGNRERDLYNTNEPVLHGYSVLGNPFVPV